MHGFMVSLNSYHEKYSVELTLPRAGNIRGAFFVDVQEWLEQYDLAPEMHWGFNQNNGEFIRYSFDIRDFALLFKLTWGGK